MVTTVHLSLLSPRTQVFICVPTRKGWWTVVLHAHCARRVWTQARGFAARLWQATWTRCMSCGTTLLSHLQYQQLRHSYCSPPAITQSCVALRWKTEKSLEFNIDILNNVLQRKIEQKKDENPSMNVQGGSLKLTKRGLSQLRMWLVLNYYVTPDFLTSYS